MITFLASILIWLMFFGLVVLWVIDGKNKKGIVIHALFAILIAWLITELIKNFFPTTRPYFTNGFEPKTLTFHVDSAFPSTHTASSFAMVFSIYNHNKKLGLIYFVCACFVGVARIIAHVHYPVDVLAGVLIGFISYRLTSGKHFVRLLS